MKEILANMMFNKGLVFRLYKEFLQFNKKTKPQLNKIGKIFE